MEKDRLKNFGWLRLRVPVWLTLGRGCREVSSECNILESCVGSELSSLENTFTALLEWGFWGAELCCAVQCLLAPYKPETIQA